MEIKISLKTRTQIDTYNTIEINNMDTSVRVKWAIRYNRQMKNLINSVWKVTLYICYMISIKHPAENPAERYIKEVSFWDY